MNKLKVFNMLIYTVFINETDILYLYLTYF